MACSRADGGGGGGRKGAQGASDRRAANWPAIKANPCSDGANGPIQCCAGIQTQGASNILTSAAARWRRQLAGSSSEELVGNFVLAGSLDIIEVGNETVDSCRGHIGRKLPSGSIAGHVSHCRTTGKRGATSSMSHLRTTARGRARLFGHGRRAGRLPQGHWRGPRQRGCSGASCLATTRCRFPQGGELTEKQGMRGHARTGQGSWRRS